MLVRASLGGDATAFGALVNRYSGPLFNATYRITHSHEDAVDATQSAFVKAYEKLNTFDFSHRFFSWIYRIALNEAFNLLQKRRHETELPPEVGPAPDDPAAEAEKAEQGALVQRALMALAPQTRALLVLRHFQGLSYADLAEVLGIPERTVKSRLFSARQRLREILRDRGWLA